MGTRDEMSAGASESPNAGEYPVGGRIPGTPFKVLQVVGRGGHAAVYDVENAIGKRLVVKVVHPHLAARGDFAARIEGEARTLVQLEHPNIVAVYDLGVTAEERPRPFIVMERLNGKNGREILQEVGRVEVRHAVDIGIDICAALSAAHGKKVVHQDIKPDNIFIHVGPEGRPVIKLVDFGIVRMLDVPQERGVFEGTILYAAPEQLQFEPVTVQTDLYAVGLLLFELMAGVRPFPDLDDAPDASAAVRMRLAHVSGALPSLSQWLLVPAELEALIHRCLAVDAADRPQSARALGDALREVRRKLASAPRDAQLRTEATLLGAVAEVRPSASRQPGMATATFAAPGSEEAPRVGRFGMPHNADARIARGVLTAELAAQGPGTARLPHGGLHGRFGSEDDAARVGGPVRGAQTAAASPAPAVAQGVTAPHEPIDTGVPAYVPPMGGGGRRTLALAAGGVLVVAVAGGGWLALGRTLRRAPIAAAATGPTPPAASAPALTAAAVIAPSAALAPPPPVATAAVVDAPPRAAPPLPAPAPPRVSAHAAGAKHPHGAAADKTGDPTASWLERDSTPAPKPKKPAAPSELESF